MPHNTGEVSRDAVPCRHRALVAGVGVVSLKTQAHPPLRHACVAANGGKARAVAVFAVRRACIKDKWRTGGDWRTSRAGLAL